MFRRILAMVALMVAGLAAWISAQAAGPGRSGNPILSGWYADPEARIFDRHYWIYPTYSAPYGEQTFLDAFSSDDLVTWTKHPRVVDTTGVTWAKRAVWAPSAVEKDGAYYLFFGANDIQNDTQIGGIGVARSSQPGGPFVDHLGHPLVDKFHNGAQPIDPFVFKDTDGTYYLTYGGWRHCNIAKLNADFSGFVPFPDGTTFKEITPAGYVEGSFMFVKDGKYYFMWSEGGWTGPNYAVAYAIGTSPLGPFVRAGKILQQDPSVATGAGHHSILHAEGSSTWYIVYHRRPLGETDPNHRVVCIDEMHFDADGAILPVTITKSGVARDPIGGGASAAQAPPGFKLVWADEFDKDGAPDPANWTYEHGFVRNQELQWYQPGNAHVEHGMLVIEARRERVPNPSYDAASTDWKRNREAAEYSSASLTTRGLHSFTYGRFEMRARIDTRPGLWPAFWTLGVTGPWPHNGEIDIMEYYRNTLLANVAWGSAERNKAIWADTHAPLASFGEGWSQQFHVWRMDWDEHAITLSVDDRRLNEVDLSRTINQDAAHLNPFTNAAQSIILNLAVGGNGGDPSQTTFPAKFEVDYVRVYQPATPRVTSSTAEMRSGRPSAPGRVPAGAAR